MTRISFWAEQLALALSTALVKRTHEFSSHSLVMLAIDCHPWLRSLSFGVLTSDELTHQPFLANPEEMAAWHFFDFPSSCPSWRSTQSLTEEMKQAYYKGNDPQANAHFYFEQCAFALNTNLVQQALKHYALSPDFRLSVAHPDTGQEFYPPFH